MKNSTTRSQGLNQSLRRAAVDECNERLKRAYDSFGRDAPICFSITGPAHSGKTTLIRKFRDDHAQLECAQKFAQSIVIVAMPIRPTIKTLVLEILHVLNSPAPRRVSEDKLMNLAIASLREAGTRVLIIDDFQTVRDGCSPIQSSRVTDGIKMLIECIGLPVVTVGRRKCDRAIQQDEQLARRFQQSSRLMRRSNRPNARKHGPATTVKCSQYVQDAGTTDALLLNGDQA